MTTVNATSAGAVGIVTAGPFGTAVARHLRTLRGDVQEIESGGWSHLSACTFRVFVLAAWRPVPEICEGLDKASHALGFPFVPLVVEGCVLTVGPVVIPGRGACWDCYRRRTCQHATWDDRRSALHAYYREKPDCGPQGYLEPFAMIGAARLSETIDALAAGAVEAASLWEIDMLTRDVATSTVMGVHGCLQCGLGLIPETRSTDELRRHLKDLWGD